MLIRVSEAAQILGVSKQRVSAMIRQGILPTAADVSFTALRREDVERLAAKPRPIGRPRKEKRAAEL